MEQYAAGVRLFDIRVKYNQDGVMQCCHGLAVYDMTLHHVFEVLRKCNDVWVMVTYEGRLEGEACDTFVSYVNTHANIWGIRLGHVSVKLPQWRVVQPSGQPAYEQNYTKIVGWKVLLPFPRLWHWLNPPKQVKDNEISMEDFV